MKRGVVLGALGFIVILGLLIDRWAESRGRSVAFGEAQRIWWDHQAHTGPGAPPAGVAFSFWLVRDFALSTEQLERGAQSARLVLLADPEALVYWNGVLVHSTRYRVGDAAVVLDVSLLLRAHNRVVFDVRSEHGAGGVMAALWLGDWSSPDANAGPVWVTDESWLATRRFDPWLLDAWVPLDARRLEQDLVPVRFWDTLDLGRWQPLRVADRVAEPTWPSTRRTRQKPGHVRPFQPAPMDRIATPTWPRGWIVDFDEAVEGCLALSGNQVFPRRVHFAADPASFTELRGPVEFAAQHGLGPSYRESWVLPLPGAQQWLDAAPRAFRAVLLEGDPGGAGFDPQDVWVQECAGPADPTGPARLFGS